LINGINQIFIVRLVFISSISSLIEQFDLTKISVVYQHDTNPNIFLTGKNIDLVQMLSLFKPTLIYPKQKIL